MPEILDVVIDAVISDDGKTCRVYMRGVWPQGEAPDLPYVGSGFRNTVSVFPGRDMKVSAFAIDTSGGLADG